MSEKEIPVVDPVDATQVTELPKPPKKSVHAKTNEATEPPVSVAVPAPVKPPKKSTKKPEPVQEVKEVEEIPDDIFSPDPDEPSEAEMPISVEEEDSAPAQKTPQPASEDPPTSAQKRSSHGLR